MAAVIHPSEQGQNKGYVITHTHTKAQQSLNTTKNKEKKQTNKHTALLSHGSNNRNTMLLHSARNLTKNSQELCFSYPNSKIFCSSYCTPIVVWPAC